MCWFIICDNEEYLTRSSVIAVEESSMKSYEVKNQMMTFTKNLEAKIGNSTILVFELNNPERIYYSLFGAVIDEDSIDLPYGDSFMDLDVNEIDTSYLSELDNLIGAQVPLPNKYGLPLLAIVKKRKLNFKGEPVRSLNLSLILDSRIFELEFPDGRIEEYSVNVILENMVDQVKSNDWDASLFDEFISARKDKKIAVEKGERAFTIVDGIRKPIITTKGWNIQIKCKDGSVS